MADGPRKHCCFEGCNKSWPLKSGDEGQRFYCTKHIKNARPALRGRFKMVRQKYFGEMRKRVPNDKRIERLWSLHEHIFRQIEKEANRIGDFEGAPPELDALGLL